MHHNLYFSLLVSVASTVKLCQFEVSLSKALATVIVPLSGLILKAFVASLLLSIENLGGGKSSENTFCRRFFFLSKENTATPQGD